MTPGLVAAVLAFCSSAALVPAVFNATASGAVALRHTGEARSDSDTAEIVGTVRRWWTAWQQRDLEAIAAMALEDYVEFTGQSPGPRAGRALLLETARRAFQRAVLTGWEIEQPVVRREGDVAVVVYRWREQATVDGRPTSLEGVATDVLVRRGGRWQYLAHHSTPRPAAGSPP